VRLKRFVLFIFAAALLTLDVAAQRTLSIDITQVQLDEFPLIRLHLQVRRQGAVPVQLAELSPLVTENGIPQTIESLVCPDDGSIRLSLAIVLDRSGSMARFADRPNDVDPDSTKMRDAKRAIATFLDLLTPRDEAGIFTFTTSVPFNTHVFTVERDFTFDTDALKGSLVPIAAVGGTRMWEAIIDAVRLLRVRPGRKAMILVTDGKNTQGNNFRPQAVQNAVDAGIPVYSIGIGGDVDVNELTALGSATGGRFYNSPGSDGLNAIFAAIADELITDECVLKYRSTSACPDATQRYVDVQIGGGGLLAEDDTTYTAPDRWERISFEARPPATIPSRSRFRVPVHPATMISSTTPVTYSMTVRYDNAFMRWLSVDVNGSISEGLPLSVRESSPGVLLVEMAGGVPARPDGSLFELEFDALVVPDDFPTTIIISEARFATLCPFIVTAFPGQLTLLPCEESFTLGGSGRVVVLPGESVSVPVRIDPRPTAGDRIVYRGGITYDAALLRYDGISLNGSVVDGSALVTGGEGTLAITVDGVARDGSDVFATLRFTSASIKSAERTSIVFSSSEFSTACKTLADWKPVELYVDGICQPLVRRKAVAQFSNHPNPVSGHTTFTFSVPEEGTVRLHVIDAYGRQMRQLLQAAMPAGEYTHTFDASGLPAGEYLGVLETRGGIITRKILVVK
jgi:hypothetical protein